MKRLVLVLTAALAGFAAACGGGSGSSTPPPPTGGFSNASLKGSYAYSMTGTDANANPGALIVRVGSFMADGNGNITQALEDVSDGGSVSQAVQFSSGTYSIQPNGKGTLTLNSVTGTGLQLTIVLNSSSSGVMSQTDLFATSSGSFNLQSPTAFAQSAITGAYSFDVSGTDGSGNPQSVVGEFTTNGGGSISGGLVDVNDAGTLSAAQAFTSGGTYTFDPTNGSTFGRGSVTFGGLAFVFYVVDGTHIKLLEEDSSGASTSGDALQQSGTLTQVPASGFAFLIGGNAVTGTAGPIARGGRFTTDASGNLTTIFLDDNNTGTRTSINPTQNSFSNAKLTIDGANPGTGRGTITFTASGQNNPFTFVFYLITPSTAVIQDTSFGVVGDGTLLAQSGTFSDSSLATGYAVNWQGTNLALGFEEDFCGQYTLSSTGGVSGVIDFVELASPSKRNPAFLNTALSGNLTLNGDGTQRNVYVFTATPSGAPSTTFNFATYIAGSSSAPTVFLVDMDSNRVDAGSASNQTP